MSSGARQRDRAKSTQKQERTGDAERRYRLTAKATLDRRSLQELVARAPAGIGLLHGPELRWTYVNDALVRMAGRAASTDLLTKTVRESLPEFHAPDFAELLENVYRTGQPYAGREVRLLVQRNASAQPEEAYFDFVYQPVSDAEGKTSAVLVHATDATEKVRTRRVIQEDAARLGMAQTAAQVGTWEWDPILNRQELSPELDRIFGVDAADPERIEKWASRVHPEDTPKVQAMMEEGHRAGNMEFEYRYIHPELGLRWLYCKGRRLPDETRMFGIVQDVTDRKAAVDASHRLAAIVEYSDDAIVSKDLRGVVTSWNPGAQRMFGYTAEEMIGEPIMRIIPPELQADETRILATIARGERIEHFETVRLNKSGESVEVSLTVSPVKDQAGNIVGAAKIARDVTQRKRAERALQTTERLASVGRLAATIAHEINNPLEAITNLVYLARTAGNRGEVDKYLALAEEELERVSQLTRQALGFYRETRGATSIRLGDLVTSLLPIFASRARNKTIRLEPEIYDHPEILAVAGEIRRVIANLVNNSIDAIEAGGQVRVRVAASTRRGESAQPGVRLTVADTGSGIPGTVRAQIFEPFFTTKKDVGTGLGLWVSRSIIENHRGSIRVKSSDVPGKSWTAFSIFLPLDPQPAEAVEPMQKTA
jgi:PAS domain S-box-containing protein